MLVAVADEQLLQLCFLPSRVGKKRKYNDPLKCND